MYYEGTIKIEGANCGSKDLRDELKQYEIEKYSNVALSLRESVIHLVGWG